ncbi:MAG: hypothetical protein K9L64_05890 [Candidatus Izimaplasma sp.]|nr:hypothetical protein [Candidatus Izimaplasma bacterium]
MELNNEYIKNKLSHVYWLNGGTCSGKTTMTNKLVEEYDFINIRDDIMKYRKFTNKTNHPNLQYPNPNLDWDLWFNRSTDVYVDWLHNLGKEFLDFLVVDLLSDKSEKRIVVDLGILAEEIIEIIPKERIICFYTSEKEIKRLYFFRDDHKMILDRINSDTKNPSKTIENASKSMVKFSDDIVDSCKKYGIKTIERTPDLSVEEQFDMVKKYFEL